MKRKMIVLVFSVIFLLCSNSAWSDDNNKILAKFYNDMADIVEGNMNDPDRCVKKVKDYVDEHGKDHKRAQEKEIENREQINKNATDKLDKLDFTLIQDVAGQYTIDEPYINAIQRFTNIYMKFMEQHMAHSVEIDKMLQKYMPDDPNSAY